MRVSSLQSSVTRRRIARTAAGFVGVVFGLAMFVVAALEPSEGALVLIAAWPAVFLTWLAARAASGLASANGVWSRINLEFWSLLFPMAAVSLLAPLSLHAVTMLLMEGGLDLINPTPQLDDFGRWIGISGTLVGHAHVAVLITAWWFLRRLGRAEAGSADSTQLRHAGWRALAISVATSMIPGAVLIMIPPALTLLTGLAFVPWMFYLAHTTLYRDRAELLNEALRQPQLKVVPDGLQHISALGHVEQIRWSEPFRVALHREPGPCDAQCDLHVRLIQRDAMGEQRTLALTLALPWEDGMATLVAKHERNLPRLEGAPAATMWQTLRFHASVHGVDFPEPLMASLTTDVSLFDMMQWADEATSEPVAEVVTAQR